jgi:hypothetical protein
VSAFFLVVALLAVYGIFRVVQSQARDRKYLAESKGDAPLVLDHLSHALRGVAREARTLRLSLESPIRDIAELRRGQLNATAEDVEAFDTMLMNVSRQVGDFLVVVDKLGERDQAELRDAGVSVEPIRQVLEGEGYSFERKRMTRPGMPPLDQRLEAIRNELSKIEAALQGSPRVYR